MRVQGAGLRVQGAELRVMALDINPETPNTFKVPPPIPWREAGPPTPHEDTLDSDQEVVNEALSLAGEPARVLECNGVERKAPNARCGGVG